jgi:hypothetical protein
MAKLQITLKNPDSVWDSIRDAGIDPKKVDESVYGEVFNKFVEYGEYVTIELDSETGKASVIPINQSRPEPVLCSECGAGISDCATNGCDADPSEAE